MDVFKRDERGFPSFWQLQLLGWTGLYILVLVGSLPDFKHPWAVRDDFIAVAFMFLGSCMLRPVCRSFVRRSLPWFPFEVRVFIWSMVLGATAASLFLVVVLGFANVNLADLAGNSVDFSVVLFLWCSLYFSIKQWQQSVLERERLLRAESEAREARLSALRYQLNPHFLFNSLNAVSTLVLEGNAQAATRMLAQLGELLRTTLDNQAVSEMPLSQEITFTGQYLAIEQTRLGDRLRVEISISPETLDALVPSMLLQPLVENAVRHGIAPLVEGGTIRIHSELSGGQLRISIQNSGIPHTRLKEASQPANRIGLRNTAERLKTLYGTEHTFSLQWPEAGGCQVTILLPLRRAMQQQEVAACAH